MGYRYPRLSGDGVYGWGGSYGFGGEFKFDFGHFDFEVAEVKLFGGGVGFVAEECLGDS